MLRRRLVPTLFGLAIVAALVLLRAADPYPVQAVREIAFDFYQRLKPREAADFPVRVVDIDEASLAELGQWPWPRDLLARLVDRLNEFGAAAIALDVLLPEPDRMSPSRIAATLPGVDAAALPDNDATLAAALARGPTILGFSDSPLALTPPPASKAGIAVSGTSPVNAVPRTLASVLPLPVLMDAAPGLGSISLDLAGSVDVLRRLPLVWSTGETFVPSLAVEALRVAQGASTLVVLGETGDGYMEGLRIGDFTVPTMPGGELWLYYRPPDPTLFVSARDVLAGDPAVAERIAGQIVFIGTSASGLFDIRGTTLGENIPGVAVHAQAVEQILAGTYLTRTDWVSGLEILGFAVLGVLLVLVVLRLGPLSGLAFGLLSLGTGVAVSWWLFVTQGLMIDPGFPLIGLTLVFASLLFFQFAITDADKRHIRRAFGHYVSPELLTEIERSGEELKLGGELRPLTVMFSDMRNFTAFSERHTPQDVLAVLNAMFGELGASIVRERGTIDKFVGDAIMAFWNAPVDVPDHARHACRAALGMRATMRAMNARDAFGVSAAGETIAIGIGIATGEALVGNMGLETRFDYSCIGDTVNVASRVEGACKPVGYDIVVTDEVEAAVPGLAFLDAGAIALKGKRAREPIFVLVGDEAMAASAEFTALHAEHAALVAALSKGMPGTAELAQCRDAALAVEPGLARFYAMLPSRREDYAMAVAEPTPA